MSDLGSRIRKIRGQMSIVDFSAKMGVHRNTLRTYESNQSAPDSRMLIAICKEYKVNADWLLLGVGPEKIGDKSIAEINTELLKDAIEALELALQEKGRHMEPDAKAEIISEIYQLFIEDESEGKKNKNIARLLRLVA